MKRENLWAPWRIKYIQGLDESIDCFICHNLANPQDNDDNLVLWQTNRCIVLLNLYPYNNGHLLVAPVRHIAGLDEANDEELLELTKMVRESQKVLTAAIKPQGFNIGMNFGRCAGAGLPGHLHIHIVPRWDGDTNFINVCSNTDVISQSLTELFERLKQISKEQNLPSIHP